MTRSGLRRYLLLRSLQMIPTIFFVILLTFLLIHIAPGDPVTILAGEYGATTEYLDRIRSEFGLDKSLGEQLAIYFSRILHGDLGYSYFMQRPVLDIILDRIGATFLLVSTEIVIATVLGVFLGVVSSTRRNSALDSLLKATALVGYSLPVFWLALMLMLLFAVILGLFPSQGIVSIGGSLTSPEYVIDVLRHLFLPAMTLAVYHLALIYRLTRSSMVEVLMKDFVTVARSKGLSERSVVFGHALRNALLPVVTMLGMMFGFMIGGAALVEHVFSWPGVGSLFFDAIYVRDYPIITGVFIFLSTMVVLSSLITDAVYSFLDPRIRFG